MEMKRSEIPLHLMRCPSMISTTDGGWTPQTDLSSPLVRSPHGPSFERESIRTIVASSNLTRLCLSEGYHLDEYVVDGSMDLVMFAYDRLAWELKSNRILVVPTREETTLLVVTSTDAMEQIFFDGVSIQFVKTHPRGCVCGICMRGLSQLLERGGPKIGKYEFLSSPNLPITVSRPIVAVPAHRVKLVRETGSLTVACDSLVKWMPWGKQSVAEILRVATLEGKSRIETNLLLSTFWIYTIYNGKPYRIKKVWFDMTPLSIFFDKRTCEKLSYASFVEKRYALKAVCVSSPMIEVMAERRSETCFLIPEFCFVLRPSPTGVPMHTVHSQTRTKTRSISIESIIDNIDIQEKFKDAFNLLPVEIEGTVLPTPPSLDGLCLGKRNLHEFSALRWSLVIIGGMTNNLSPSWLILNLFNGRSPTAILTCGSSHGTAAVIRRAAETSDLIVVLLKSKSSVYATVKYVSLVECGVPCQVILTESLDKESARLDLVSQIKSKIFCETIPGSENLIALDFHRFGDVSVFTIAWTVSSRVQVRYLIDQSGISLSESDMMDKFMLLLAREFVSLPRNPVIIMACRRGIPSVEIDDRLKLLFGPNDISLLIACVKSDVRVFKTNGGDNVSPGFSFDVEGGFYLVPHRVDQGNALPVLFQVVFQHLDTETLKNIVWRSYSRDHVRRLPELFRHTLKLSELIGIHLRKSVNGKDVNKCLETSQGWKNLKATYFYL
jgi:hypothetical protein